MRVALLALLLVGCVGDNIPAEPDASVDTPVPADAAVDSPPDAAPDAPDVPACWATVQYNCGGFEIIQVCVPYHGCSTFECQGQQLGYCGPG